MMRCSEPCHCGNSCTTVCFMLIKRNATVHWKMGRLKYHCAQLNQKMKDLLPSAMRPHSVVLVIAPPHSGKTALVQQLGAENSKRGTLVPITSVDEVSAV